MQLGPGSDTIMKLNASVTLLAIGESSVENGAAVAAAGASVNMLEVMAEAAAAELGHP
jgi:hypothetical protein